LKKTKNVILKNKYKESLSPALNEALDLGDTNDMLLLLLLLLYKFTKNDKCYLYAVEMKALDLAIENYLVFV